MKVTYRLKGKILDKSLKNISLVVVMKYFDHQNHLFKQIVSVASLELTLKKLEQVNPKSNNLDFRNPNTEKPEKKAPSVPEVDKETEAPIEGLKSKDKITVTVKGGENSEITDLDFYYYIYQGNFQRTISAGTTLAEFLKEIAIKEAPLDNDRKPNDVILKKGYRVSKWVDDKNNVIQSDQISRRIRRHQPMQAL
ncbi:hypothetical protein [Streptococcus suis]|uniref:LPXTG-motif cell wall anchor domain-containing protein n=3 Tax=Streptococcus suis TaxID=1307 RepID=A0A0Z8FW98_STRSU|nr:hypothetical protein [Streptococcus suis]MDG4520212.1 hypothetical protein [Streptococcus suis]NQF83064.1 hypothetical protein [Streptococcus suis]NQH66241.1 hypothetical protein [Streptococcus suis]NQL98306.1 hypothetical protein [Streptococcus suis]NQM06655.1 hypothetical protein [Streptococcus suis]